MSDHLSTHYLTLYGLKNEEEAIDHMYKVYSRDVSEGQSMMKQEEEPILKWVSDLKSKIKLIQTLCNKESAQEKSIDALNDIK